MHRRRAWLPIAAAFAAVPVWASPHADTADIVIGATGRGPGALVLAWDFARVVPVAYAGDLGSVATYAATDPGFVEAGAEGAAPEGVVPLPPGTRVWLEVVDSAGGAALKLRDVRAARAGDRVLLGVAGARPPDGLHVHPELQLVRPAGHGRLVEGRLVVRALADGGRLLPSEAYALALSNAQLPPAAWRKTSVDVRTLQCRARLGRVSRRLVAAVSARVAACGSGACEAEDVLSALDGPRAAAVASLVEACRGPRSSADDAEALGAWVDLVVSRVAVALVAPGGGAPECAAATVTAAGRMLRTRVRALVSCLQHVGLARAQEAAGVPAATRFAARRCSGSRAGALPQRLARARRAAMDAIRRACGGSAAARRAVGAAACVADDFVSAAWPEAKAELEAFEASHTGRGRSLARRFPCLRGSPPAPHGHGHEH